MKFRLPKFNFSLTPQVELPELEAKLQEVLRPVKPRASFVRSLRARLLHAPLRPELSLSLPSKKTQRYLLLGIAGILSGTLLILTGVRLVITVLGALGILHQVKRQAEQQQKLPLQPSF